MGKGIREASAAPRLEPASLSELIHQHVRTAIEAAVHEELLAALGAAPYERNGSRRATAMESGSGRSRGRLAPLRWRCLALPSSEAPA